MLFGRFMGQKSGRNSLYNMRIRSFDPLWFIRVSCTAFKYYWTLANTICIKSKLNQYLISFLRVCFSFKWIFIQFCTQFSFVISNRLTIPYQADQFMASIKFFWCRWIGFLFDRLARTHTHNTILDFNPDFF